MDKKEAEFLEQLLSTFRIEAEESLDAMTSKLLELEKKPAAKKKINIIETIYREAHSLKGASRSVNLTNVEAILQQMESIFSDLKHERISLSPWLFEVIYNAIEMVRELISSPDRVETGKISKLIDKLSKKAATPKSKTKLQGKIEKSKKITAKPSLRDFKTKGRREKVLEKKEEVPLKAAPGAKDSSFLNEKITKEKSILPETVRISTSKLDSLLLQAEEMLSVKLTTTQRFIDIKKAIMILNKWEEEWKRVSRELPNVGELLNADKNNGNGKIALKAVKLKEFLDRNDNNMKLLKSSLLKLSKSIDNDQRLFGGMIDNLLDDVKNVLMLPFSRILEGFPKMVRDLAIDKGEEIDLVINGSEVEIDKRIMEEIKIPFIHLIRNCVDHGIELPKERVKNKKLPQGKIEIDISTLENQNIEILFSDDGAGINLDKVKESAIKHSIVTKEEANELSGKEALSLIFQSEVSANPIITDISGRGLGLAIVKEAVERLGGSVSVETKQGVGTTLKAALPSTLATFRGVIVKTAGYRFIIPTLNVERMMRIKKEDIKTVENKETIAVNGHTVPFARLDDILELVPKDKDSKFINILILSIAENSIAFSVDEVINEQEVLTKKPGRQLSCVRNIAGVTIIGSGRVVPVLNVSDLIRSTVKLTGAAKVASRPKKIEAEKKSILVVDDSITSRTLLKNIVKSADYNVKTAIDGSEAFELLLTEKFDLLVTDIQMPGMDGFVLTSKVRSNRKLSRLPVVLMTGLESREDREKGIDVGADAYIMKGSFDQNNLLDIIRRLL